MTKLYERLAETFDGSRRLASARLRYSVLQALHIALQESGLNKSHIADCLGVRKSAVSQVFNGDGNLRINTLAEYMAAMDREVVISTSPLGHPRREVERETHRELNSQNVIWNVSKAAPVKERGRVRSDTVAAWRPLDAHV